MIMDTFDVQDMSMRFCKDVFCIPFRLSLNAESDTNFSFLGRKGRFLLEGISIAELLK